ncbi:hypothetical protein [Micromonospora sp. CA-111912]
MIHHVLLACPPGSEAASRAFYGGLLGMTEKPNPTEDAHGNRLEFVTPL